MPGVVRRDMAKILLNSVSLLRWGDNKVSKGFSKDEAGLSNENLGFKQWTGC